MKRSKRGLIHWLAMIVCASGWVYIYFTTPAIHTPVYLTAEIAFCVLVATDDSSKRGGDHE